MALLTEEQQMLRESAKGFVKQNAPVGALRKLRDSKSATRLDPAMLKSVAAMGWTGVLIPESYGGSDFGVSSIGIVLEELGRNLVAAPLIGSAVGAVSALTLGGSEAQRKEWLPKIASGTALAALAIDEGTRYRPETITLAATKKGSGYTLKGIKTFVHEGMAADVFVVAARSKGRPSDEAGVTLFLIPAAAKGLQRERRQLMDSRGYATLTLDDVAVGAEAVVGEVDRGRGLLDKVLDRVCAAVAAETLGVAVQAFETTVAYMKTRVQFGQTIGSFQALQHRAAKMFTDIQLARPTVEGALQALDAGQEDAPALVSLAKATANDLANLLTREMIQLHGGIGMTDPHDAGFYIKRARVLESAFGTSAYHRERYGRLVGV